MQQLPFDAAHIQAIDDALWEVYGSTLGGSELTQLARLFGRSVFLQRLKQILQSTLPPAGRYYRVELDVSLAWIDKRPLAKLHHRSRRVELGDAALFYIAILHTGGRTIFNGARAMIVQAKAANAQSQIAAPTVPINPPHPTPDSSTDLELDLLSTWKPFDLFAASRSKFAVVADLKIGASGHPPPFGWFIATPREPPRGAQSQAWRSPWMSGPAMVHAPCDLTLGFLLARFFDPYGIAKPSAGGVEAGAPFQFDSAQLMAPNGDGWDRLCHELLRLTGTHQLPRALFGSAPLPTGGISRAVLRSLPYLDDGGREGRRRNWLSLISDFVWPRRFPIVIVTTVAIEGDA